jgi:hypothetical protein
VGLQLGFLTFGLTLPANSEAVSGASVAPSSWVQRFRAQLGICLGVYTPLVVISALCWVYIEFTDPAKPGGVPCWLMRETQQTVSHCGLCDKEVVGLGGFSWCDWLR